jgi:hypothetical protein
MAHKSVPWNRIILNLSFLSFSSSLLLSYLIFSFLFFSSLLLLYLSSHLILSYLTHQIEPEKVGDGGSSSVAQDSIEKVAPDPPSPSSLSSSRSFFAMSFFAILRLDLFPRQQSPPSQEPDHPFVEDPQILQEETNEMLNLTFPSVKSDDEAQSQLEKAQLDKQCKRFSLFADSASL